MNDEFKSYKGNPEEYKKFRESIQYPLDFSEVNIKLACEYFRAKFYNQDTVDTKTKLIYKICSNYNEWIGTPHEEKFTTMIYDYGGPKGDKTFYKLLKESLLPVNQRSFIKGYVIENDGKKTPIWADITNDLANTHYVYVHHDEEGEYGTIFWISEGCERTLKMVPVRKTLTPRLRVGKFYAITLKEILYFDKRFDRKFNTWNYCKKKYFYHIKEVNEETYIRKGLLTPITRW